MQIKRLHGSIYTLSSYACRQNSTLGEASKGIASYVQTWQRLKKEGVSDTLCQDMKMGERLQINHMTVTKNGVTVKQFQA